MVSRTRKKAVTASAAEMHPPPPATTPPHPPIPIPGPNGAKETREKGSYSYEKLREERIKENLERIQKLGIIELSHNLNSCNARRRSAKPAPIAIAAAAAAAAPSNGKLKPPPPPRRSSRLQNTSPVSYAEIPVEKEEKPGRSGLALVAQGEREEIYTDEHAALLGSCEATWTLFVDGCGSDGKRIYDQIKGKTCHQCRQKTLGHHTHCSRCNLLQGQFCGDCLYMRYGENILEAKRNVNWICPVCRGICNCSLCRTKKGWAPTGALYRKVSNLGFKSVAHYLIQTRRSQTSSEDQISGHLASSSEELAPVSNAEETSGLDTLDLEKGLNSEIADEHNNNEFQTKLISFAGSEVPSHPQESLMVENGLNKDPSEEGSNDFNRESILQCADEHTPSDISRGSIAKPREKSKKTKEPGAVEKLRSGSIASRLRKRVRIPTA